MILDTLTQWRRYAALSQRFQKAFAFLHQIDGNAKVGRQEIDGDDIYALVQKFTTERSTDGPFEVHRRYIDVQYVHAGRETILWTPLSSLTKVNMAYDEKQDAALFALISTTTPLHLSAGQFAIFFPDDGHAPGRIWEQPSEVFKVVVKVRV